MSVIRRVIKMGSSVKSVIKLLSILWSVGVCFESWLKHVMA